MRPIRTSIWVVLVLTLIGCGATTSKFTGQRTNSYQCGNLTCTYTGSWLNGKKHGYGVIVWSNGGRFEGEWRDDQRLSGKYTWKSQPDDLSEEVAYEGSWSNGQRHGHGTERYRNGNRYEGMFASGSRNGQGTMWWYVADEKQPQPRYTGDWKNGRRSGEGHMLFFDGSEYRGGWANDRMHGVGTYNFRGVEYIGTFQNGRWAGEGPVPFEAYEPGLGRYVWERQSSPGTGTGRYIWPNGTEYEGEFVDGRLEGHGMKRWVTTHRGNRAFDLYIGRWENNQLNGHGTLTRADGYRYSGQWRDGKAHGAGVQEYASGERYDGNSVDGRREGYGNVRYTNGSSYEGGWKEGKIHGYGVYRFADGRRYEGMYVDGKRSGSGTFYWPNGDRYEGPWRDDVRSGRGSFYFKKGNMTYVGNYSKGKRHGDFVVRYPNESWERHRYANGEWVARLETSGGGADVGKIFALAAGAALAGSSQLSSADKVDFFSAYAQDVMTDGSGTGKPMAMNQWAGQMQARLNAERQAYEASRGGTGGAGSGHGNAAHGPKKPLRNDGICSVYNTSNHRSADLIGDQQFDSLCAAGVEYYVMYEQNHGHPDAKASELEKVYQMHVASIENANKLAQATKR